MSSQSPREPRHLCFRAASVGGSLLVDDDLRLSGQRKLTLQGARYSCRLRTSLYG